MEFLNLSRVKTLNILLLIMFLSSCSLLDPFVDRRREAGAPNPESLYIGRSTPEKPAVCYNIFATNYKTVKKIADEECQKQKTGLYAEPLNQTVFTCRVLVPNHYYFKCIK